MCPDRSLWSAFADGEVPSPWKERMERHAAGCSRCASILAGYRGLSAILGSELPRQEARALDRARLQASRALDARLRGLQAAGSKAGFLQSAWRGSFRIPAPMAMAAAVAIVVLAGFMLVVTGGNGRRQLQATQEVLAANADALDQLVRYLDAKGASQAVVIRLPEGSSYAAPGEPVIMTAPNGKASIGTAVSYPVSATGEGR